MSFDAIGELRKVFEQFNLLKITSWDLLILLFLGLVTVAYTFLFVNRGRLLPLLVSTYMAFVLVNFAPFLTFDLAKLAGLSELFVFRVAVFAVILLLVLFILSRVILQSPVGSETLGIVGSFLLSLSQTGFLVAVLVSFLPSEITKEFSDFTSRVFVGREVLFYWAAAPVILLLLLGHKANQDVG